MVNASSADVARYERRGVKVINLPGSREKYGEILAAAFRELREYMRENVITVSKVTEEQPLHELLLPRDTETRLCFFSLPLEMLPFYRERVFPVVEEVGFVPVTADDVVTPGDNVSAKLDALIDRASVMIVELSSPWTAAEYRMAIARIKGSESKGAKQRRLRLFVVVTDRKQLPPTATDFPVVTRPNVVTDDPTGFIAALHDHLLTIANEVGAVRQAEPKRLLAAREYRAAVISAMALLEVKLRERLSKSQWPQTRRPMSFRSLADLAVETGQITPQVRNRIDPWMRVRNEVVHSSISVSPAQARQIVNGVMELLQGWN
jgi:hypothetical protein